MDRPDIATVGKAIDRCSSPSPLAAKSPWAARWRSRLGDREPAYSLRFHGLARIAVVCVGVALAVGTIGLLMLSRRRTELMTAGGELVFTGSFRRRVLSPERVLAVEVAWSKASRRRSRLWVLVNASGRAVVGLNRDAWDEGQLEGLRESLGLPIETVSTPKRPAELRKVYPGIVPWWSAHVSLATVFAILTLAAVVLAVEGLVS